MYLTFHTFRSSEASPVPSSEMKLWFDVKVHSIATSLSAPVVCKSGGVLGCLQMCVGVKYGLLCAFMCVSVCAETILF